MRILRLNRLSDVVRSVSGGRAVVAVGADLGVHEKAIEESEALRERVVVRRDALSKEGQRRITIALGHVAEDLIVSTVLFNDVDHVLEGGILRRCSRRVPAV